VVATDEFLLSPEPYGTRDAWCRDRVAVTRKRLEDLDWMTPTVLVNHFPMVRQPCDALFYPEFSLWCGTVETADWHTRYNAACSVYGHLHIPRTTYYDGVRFEEVSVGYPREWRGRQAHRWPPRVPPARRPRRAWWLPPAGAAWARPPRLCSPSGCPTPRLLWLQTTRTTLFWIVERPQNYLLLTLINFQKVLQKSATARDLYSSKQVFRTLHGGA